MSYEEFMKELGGLLAGVPEEEKEEALQYYSDYFADAGRENENQVLSELGSPRKVAELIKAGLRNGGMDGGEFTEYGYTDERFAKKDDLMRREPKKEKKSQNRRKAPIAGAHIGSRKEATIPMETEARRMKAAPAHIIMERIRMEMHMETGIRGILPISRKAGHGRTAV